MFDFGIVDLTEPTDTPYGRRRILLFRCLECSTPRCPAGVVWYIKLDGSAVPARGCV